MDKKAYETAKRIGKTTIVGGLCFLAGLGIRPALNYLNRYVAKNRLAMTELVPLIEMDDGKPGLSMGDTRNFYTKIFSLTRDKSEDTTLNSTPGGLYFDLRNLSRDQIENLIQSYQQ